MNRAIICILLAFTFGITASAQNYNHYINSSYNYELNKALDSISNFHTSIKPFVINDINRYLNYDSLQKRGAKIFANNNRLKLKNKIFNQHLVEVKDKNFVLYIDPLMNFEVGRDFNYDKTTWVNTRGVQVMGSIGKKISFYANFYENQGSFSAYVDDAIKSNYIEDDYKMQLEYAGIVPGQGKAKYFGDNGYDYSNASGYISYSPSEHFNFQFGTGKHFIGDGYRSLLLSDNSFNYPYLKISTTIWKLKLMNLFTQFQDLKTEHSSNLGYNKKYAAIHYLSWNVNKRLSIGVFEAIIFQARDSIGNRGFELSYLNPIIFYRPVESSLGSPDNAIMGINFSYRIKTKNSIYGQFILDEFKLKELSNGSGWWGNKFGYQLGIKCYDFINTKNLYVQFEYNRVRPYTYSHWTTLQNYGHYNQPLAHPLGANFWEFISILKYHRERLYLNYKFIYANYGENIGDDNYGKNIFISYETRIQEFNNNVAQGLTTKLIYNNIELSYLINPSYNLNFVLGYTSRIVKTDLGKDNTNHIYIGLRTSINNFYYDF